MSPESRQQCPVMSLRRKTFLNTLFALMSPQTLHSAWGNPAALGTHLWGLWMKVWVTVAEIVAFAQVFLMLYSYITPLISQWQLEEGTSFPTTRKEKILFTKTNEWTDGQSCYIYIELSSPYLSLLTSWQLYGDLLVMLKLHLFLASDYFILTV